MAVHVYGRVEFFDDKDRLLDLVTHLTEIHEEVGFEMPILKIEGKWKLNQNRKKSDRSGVMRGLEELDHPKADAISKEMKLRASEEQKDTEPQF